MKTLLATHLIVAVALSGSFTASPATANPIKSRTQSPVAFQNILQDLSVFVGQDGASPQITGVKELNLSHIQLNHDHNVSIFFVGETAGYRNQLDFLAVRANNVVQSQTKIFGDTSCSSSDHNFQNFNVFCPSSNSPLADKTSPQDRPLNVGDFMELGKMTAGTQLDFLLVANGAQNSSSQDLRRETYSLNTANNSDKIQHVKTYYYRDYLILGYEDLWGGGDRDYNDAVFALDIGHNNARKLAGVSVPEPSATAGILCVGMVSFLKGRWRRGKNASG